MYLGHVSGRKVVPDCRRLGSSASYCRLQKGYPLCACQHTDSNDREAVHLSKSGSPPYCMCHISLPGYILSLFKYYKVF